MAKYLISFPSAAMTARGDELAAASVDSRAVIEQAKAAGVYVFGGGIDERVEAVRVAGDGSVSKDTYPETRNLNGGFAVFELPSRKEAIEWAAKLAAACRCAQELREFGYDPAS